MILNLMKNIWIKSDKIHKINKIHKTHKIPVVSPRAIEKFKPFRLFI